MNNGADWELQRRSYRPSVIKLLFIGESRPRNGTFFYAGDSVLFSAINDAFRVPFPTTDADGFLTFFAGRGCYLEDLCLDPVNQWEINDSRRIAARRAGEGALGSRLKGLAPAAVVVVMKAIAPNISRVLASAAISCPVHELPFPARLKHRQEFVRELGQIVCGLKRDGALLP